MSTLTKAIVVDLLNNPPFRVLPASKQLILAFEGIYIASTTVLAKPLLVWETEKEYPRYYIPIDSLHQDVRSLVGNGLERGKITISGKSYSMDSSATLKSSTNDSEAVIDYLRYGERTLSLVRFSKGPLKGYIKFDRAEIGKLKTCKV